MKRVLWVLALSLAGCGSSSDVKVEISPTTATVTLGQTTRFSGTQTVTTANSIDVNDNAALFDWSVVEPSGGTLAPDSFGGSSYVYTAPVGPGIFHVQIASKMDASAKARATVTVVAP